MANALKRICFKVKQGESYMTISLLFVLTESIDPNIETRLTRIAT